MEVNDFTKLSMDRLYLDEFNCPSNRTFKVKGNNLDNTFISIHITFQRCIQRLITDKTIRCKSADDINSMVKKLEV